MIKELLNMRRLGKAAFNPELTSIYNEVKPTFMHTLQSHFNALSTEDVEELFDDAILAFYQNVESGQLSELTCSISTYVCRIGRNKAVDKIRREHKGQQVETPVENLWSLIDKYWNDDSEDEEEKRSIVEDVVRRITEPCRRILKMFYYESAPMKVIADALGYANANVAKTKKNICLAKARTLAGEELKTIGH